MSMMIAGAAARIETGGTLEAAIDAVRHNAPRLGIERPRIGLADLTYERCGPADWVDGFWPGQLWLAYRATGDDAFRDAAAAYRPYFAERLTRPLDCDHDLGFLYSLSAVADYKLTGDAGSRAVGLAAADLLAARFNRAGRYIQAWNPRPHAFPDGYPVEGRIIIDCLLNLGLLYWAARESGRAELAEIATAHADTALRYLVRPDASTYHSFNFDPETGAPIAGTTVQGFADESCWSRGQAWGVHGFALVHAYTGEPRFLEASRRLAGYVAAQLPDGGVPPWDYRLPDGAGTPLDSSAGAITAAGLFLLADQDEAGAPRWRKLASAMLRSLEDRCGLLDRPEAEGLLDHGASFVAEGLSDTMLPYGDYFFLEALLRERGETRFAW